MQAADRARAACRSGLAKIAHATRLRMLANAVTGDEEEPTLAPSAEDMSTIIEVRSYPFSSSALPAADLTRLCLVHRKV